MDQGLGRQGEVWGQLDIGVQRSGRLYFNCQLCDLVRFLILRQANSMTGFKLALQEIRPQNPGFRQLVGNCPKKFFPKARTMGQQFSANSYTLVKECP